MERSDFNGEEQQDPAAEPNGAEPRVTTDEAPPAPSAEDLTAARDRLAAQNADLKDKLLRLRAEFDNFRKRVHRERAESHQFAAMEAVRAMLPVLDALERALASEQPDESGENFYAGVQLIERQLREALARLGLQPMEVVGKQFDPYLHEAVERVETSEHEDQIILEEWQRGYLFNGRVLRPAMVKVAVHPNASEK